MGDVEGKVSLRVHAGTLQKSTDGGVTWNDAGGAGNTILARAQALLPSSGLTKVLGPGDFDGSALFGEAAGTTGTATPAMSLTHKGGVVKVATGATANSLIQICTPGTNVANRGIASLVDNARTTPWYLYTEFYVATAIDANATLRVQLAAMAGGAPANPTFGIGATGALSTTNFSYRLTDGAGAVAASGTGPVLDTNKHTAEIYNDGTTAKVLFDGVQIGADIAATLIGTVPMTWTAAAVNGATAASREIDIDALYVVV